MKRKRLTLAALLLIISVSTLGAVGQPGCPGEGIDFYKYLYACFRIYATYLSCHNSPCTAHNMITATHNILAKFCLEAFWGEGLAILRLQKGRCGSTH